MKTKRAKVTKEWTRALFHTCSGLTVVLVYGLTNIGRGQALVILGAVALFFLLGDVLRQFIPSVNRLARKMFRLIMRPEEKDRIASTTYYVIGCWVAILTFPRVIACISILFLAVSDTLAKMIRHTRNRYFIPEAILGNFLVCFSMAWLLFKVTETPGAVLLSFLGALGASLAEMIPKVDNLAIPLFGGVLIGFGIYLIG